METLLLLKAMSTLKTVMSLAICLEIILVIYVISN